MSKVEVLVATMNQNDLSKFKDMNIQTHAIFANQADGFSYESKHILNKRIKMITTSERGVGKNRNVALLHATEEICMISDDDMVYVNDYEEKVVKAFEKIPNADIIIFNISSGGNSDRRNNKKITRVYLHNFMNYGSARIAFRRQSIISKNIWFSLLFGGGAKYGSGEDSLFLREALRKGLKIYTFPYQIAELVDRGSTWFTGYNQKFFFDKGAFLEAAFPKLKYIIAIYFVTKFKKKSSASYLKLFNWMLRGMKAFRDGKSYDEVNKVEFLGEF